jgi:hypothetical protein
LLDLAPVSRYTILKRHIAKNKESSMDILTQVIARVPGR